MLTLCIVNKFGGSIEYYIIFLRKEETVKGMVQQIFFFYIWYFPQRPWYSPEVIFILKFQVQSYDHSLMSTFDICAHKNVNNSQLDKITLDSCNDFAK